MSVLESVIDTVFSSHFYQLIVELDAIELNENNGKS